MMISTEKNSLKDKIGVHMIDCGHVCGPWLSEFPNLTSGLIKETPFSEKYLGPGPIKNAGEDSTLHPGFREGQDDNYLYGLQSLIHILKSI
jgi:hypothetical protein